ncbi:MAG: hypothetical protein U1F40_12435 [Turneriella sp.]
MILAIEAFSYTPHLETAAEICLRKIHENGKVAFCFLDVPNPDDIPYPEPTGWLAESRSLKVRQLEAILRKKGVLVINSPTISSDTQREAREIAQTSIAAMTDLQQLAFFEYDGVNLGLGALSSLISRSGEPYPPKEELAEVAALYLESAIITYQLAKNIISHHKPKVICTFNGRFACSRSIVEVARQNNISIWFHERGAQPNKYYLSDLSPHDLRNRKPEVIKLWNEANNDKYADAAGFFERRRQGDGIGWLSFTEQQERGMLPEKSQKKTIVYYSSSDDEYAAVERLVSHGLFSSQRNAIKWLIEKIQSMDDTELLIRVHPHMKSKGRHDRSWWENLSGKNIKVIPAASEVDSYELALSANLVLVFGSTMGVEAAYLGKPVIALDDVFYGGLDCVYEPKSITELSNLIVTPTLPGKPKEHALPYGYYMLHFGDDFQYFEPEGLFEGKLLGKRLTGKPWIRRLARKVVLPMRSLRSHFCHSNSAQ